MKFLVASIFAVYLLVGCQSGGHWTANELRDWYVKLEQSDPRFLTPLYYRGTDQYFHYFLCRSMDTWVPVKVSKEEIDIEDIRPYESVSQAEYFPGYYTVDPEQGFKKISEKRE